MQRQQKANDEMNSLLEEQKIRDEKIAALESELTSAKKEKDDMGLQMKTERVSGSLILGKI